MDSLYITNHSNNIIPVKINNYTFEKYPSELLFNELPTLGSN